MKLDSNFFDSIQLAKYDGAYYSAKEVDALLSVIRLGFEDLCRENEALASGARGEGCNQEFQDYSVAQVERMYSAMKKQHEDAIDLLNRQWQEFLSGITAFDGQSPEDLYGKINRIAVEIREISADK